MAVVASASVASTRSRTARGGEPRVLLLDVPWKQYVAICDAVGERPALRMTYVDGELEIMTTSRQHELLKKLIARLVEAYGDENDIPLVGIGSATFRQEIEKVGLEPDECYSIGEARVPPDIAIEVIVSSGSTRKLDAYRRLGVREVWFWQRGRFRLFGLDRGRYVSIEQSRLVPGLDFRALAAIVTSTSPDEQPLAVRRYRQTLRRRV